MKRVRAGFTLIELLVVIGIIGVLAAVLGMSLGRGNSGTALQSAQAVTASLLGGARAQAATALQEGGLFINVNASSENFLREFYVAVFDGTYWRVKGDATLFPQGAYLVPNTGSFSSANVSYDAENGAWSKYSDSFPASAVTLYGTTGTTAINSEPGNSYRLVVSFTPRGTLSSAMNSIVLGPAERTSDTSLVFNNSNALRGMTVSTYGIATLIHDPAGLP